MGKELDWISIDLNEQKLVCNRCGKKENTPWSKEPYGMTYGLEVLKAFGKVHSKCKEKKKTVADKKQ